MPWIHSPLPYGLEPQIRKQLEIHQCLETISLRFIAFYFEGFPMLDDWIHACLIYLTCYSTSVFCKPPSHYFTYDNNEI